MPQRVSIDEHDLASQMTAFLNNAELVVFGVSEDDDPSVMMCTSINDFQ